MGIPVVNDLTPRSGPYTATGGQTTFVYGFPIWEANDLVVYVNSVLKTLCRLELLLMGRNRLAGLSVFVLAQKP